MFTLFSHKRVRNLISIKANSSSFYFTKIKRGCKNHTIEREVACILILKEEDYTRIARAENLKGLMHCIILKRLIAQHRMLKERQDTLQC